MLVGSVYVDSYYEGSHMLNTCKEIPTIVLCQIVIYDKLFAWWYWVLEINIVLLDWITKVECLANVMNKSFVSKQNKKEIAWMGDSSEC